MNTLSKFAEKFKMTHIDEEEQQYLQDVEAVKQWWTDSRWRFTKRPFTAEQIVQKRGNLKIDYPSNVMAKKLWKLMEDRFAVMLYHHVFQTMLTAQPSEPHCVRHVRVPRAHHAHADEQVPRHRLCFRMAILVDGFLNR